MEPWDVLPYDKNNKEWRKEFLAMLLSDEHVKKAFLSHYYSKETDLRKMDHYMSNNIYKHALEETKHMALSKVLDIGCGASIFGIILAVQRRCYVVGVDLSRRLIKLGKFFKKALDPTLAIDFVVADALKLPFRDATFDVATCFEVIEHVRDVCTFLKQIRGILKFKGSLILTTPNKVASLWPTASRNPEHLREYSLQELVDALNSMGFSVKKKKILCVYFPSHDFIVRYIPRSLFSRCYAPITRSVETAKCINLFFCREIMVVCEAEEDSSSFP